jgi:hypothetical protein
MSGSNDVARLSLVSSVAAWRNFWFREEPAYTLGLVRIAFGALTVGFTAALLPDLNDLFGTNGVVPTPPSIRNGWSVFQVWPSDHALLVGWAVLLVSAVALTVGWHSRLAAILVFVLIVSFQRRDPWMWNSGDTLIRLEAFFIAIAPSGAALSLDQRRRTGAFWSAQSRPRWPLRLMMVQLSLIYLATVQVKMMGQTWGEGTAVSYAWRSEAPWVLLPVPQWLSTNLLITNVATWSTLVVEVAIAVLVWKRRWRPWVLAVGVGLHLSIMVTLNVGFFSLAMFVLYLAFIPPEATQRLPEILGAKAENLSARLRRLTAGGQQSEVTESSDAARDSMDDAPRDELSDWPVHTGSDLAVADASVKPGAATELVATNGQPHPG